MPDIFSSTTAYKRDSGGLPELKLQNMFIEKSPSAEKGVVLISRRGLLLTATRGAGPINGIFQRPGTLAGDVFTVSGGTLYRNATSLGAINGTGPVSWAASAIELVVTRGTTAYSYNGTNLAAIAIPDSANVTAVTFIAGLFVYARAGSHKFYWSAVLNARTIDPLDFASAENAPDELRDIIRIGDSLLMLGQDSTETWVPTGDLNLPFSRIVQRLYGKGVIATGCAEEMDNTLFMVGHDGMVYRLGDVMDRISDHGIEERIAQSSTYSAFSFAHEGHSFFALRLDPGTWCYDAATGQWFQAGTYGRANWRARCAAQIGEAPLFGDDGAGTVWEFGGWADGTATLVREFTAAFPTSGSVVVSSLEVEANSGAAEVLMGQAATPVLEMRASRDAGSTYGPWRSVSLGRQGERRRRARYRALGQFDAPGAVFHFRMPDPGPFRVTRVSVNDPGGGRGR